MNSPDSRSGCRTGVKQRVNFLEIDRHDFDLIGVHFPTDWRHKRWLAAAPTGPSPAGSC